MRRSRVSGSGPHLAPTRWCKVARSTAGGLRFHSDPGIVKNGLLVFAVILGIVAVMNMVNFLDGLDGLAAGVCAISGFTFAVIELSLGRNVNELVFYFGIIPARYTVPQIAAQHTASGLFLPIFTSMFLHGGWLHLLGNMLFLFLAFSIKPIMLIHLVSFLTLNKALKEQ